MVRMMQEGCADRSIAPELDKATITTSTSTVDKMPSPAATTTSTSPSGTVSSSGGNSMNATKQEQQQQQQQHPAGTATVRPYNKNNRKQLLRSQSSTVSEASVQLTSGSLVSAFVTIFSIYFPFLLAPWAATETYHMAFYDYDPKLSHFDNTSWTYGTDYFLALVLGMLLLTISTKSPISNVHAWRSRGLLACYMVSVLAGGTAHQFYTTLEMRNTWHFRTLWTICVGLVTFASTFMGSIGAEVVRHHEHAGGHHVAKIPIVPEWFWVAFGVFTTGVCIVGGISYQRPACDIFIAGITQFPSSVYMMVILAFGLPTHPLAMRARIYGTLGFILNAPLLPMYPLLVQYTNWSLAGVNTLLHCWLLVAWGLQGLALRSIEQCLVEDFMPPPAAVPMRINIVDNSNNNKKQD